MPGYDSWKTRSPDDGLGCEPISKEQEKADWEDEMQQSDADRDLRRAIAVIADLCGAGRPAVKESAEELAEWAEEFTNRYFAKQEPFINSNHARTCALYWDRLLQGINSACGCGGLAKDRASSPLSSQEQS